MKQKDGAGRVGTISGSGYNARSYGIEPLLQDHGLGYNHVVSKDKPFVVPLLAEYESLAPNAFRREGLLKDVISRGLQRPGHNIKRNCGREA